MKKILTLVMVTALLLTGIAASIVSVSAMNCYPAIDDDTCLNGECSLDIEYTERIPTIDGVVEEDEYTQIPSDILHNWYTFILGPTVGVLTPDELYAFLRDEYTRNYMKVYGNWDGKYFYFALEASAPTDEYTCPKAADSVNLFRYWCLQCGLAAPDAQGDDRFEIGLGAPSDEDAREDCYCFDAWGRRFFKSFKKGTDYMAHWDVERGVVTYEARFPIKEITGEAPQEGSQMRFLFLLSQSGQHTQDPNDNIQIQLSYGCSQGKFAEQYVMLNFVGSTGELPQDTDDNTDEEQELEGFLGRTDFRDPDVAALLTVADGILVNEMQDENGDRYVRLQATANGGYVGGPKIPIALNADECQYVAFRYRTSSPDAKWLGLSYQTMNFKERSEEYMIANDLDFICDGEWHTTIMDMYGAPHWNAFITDMLIWPFADARGDVIGQTLDIMWIKYYSIEPEFPGETPVETTAPEEAPTEEPSETTTPVGAETADAEVTSADLTETTAEGTEGGKSGGCLSTMSVLPVGLVLTCAAWSFSKKRRESEV